MYILIIIANVVTSLIGFSNADFFQRYMFDSGAILKKKQYYRLITSSFLHVNGMHLLFNMITLYFFSVIVENKVGPFGFFALYFVAVLVGNLFSLILYRNNLSYKAVGASGGVSGIIFFAIAIAPLIPIYFFFIPIPIPGWIFGFAFFALSVYMMLNPNDNSNIGHAAHIGGSVVGIIFSFIFFPSMAIHNILYIGIMSLPLLYMIFKLINKK